MAYLLSDYARMAGSDLERGVIDVFRRESFIAEKIPWENTKRLSKEVLRTKTLPSTTFRKLNANFVESKGTVEPYFERVFDVGTQIDIDKLLMESETGAEQAALQTDMQVTSCAYTFNDYFINGQPTVDEDGFTGLFYRIMNYMTAQHVNKNGLDVSDDASGLSANFDKLFDAIDLTIHKLDGHKADLMMANSTLYHRILSGLRQKALWASTKDAFGRQIVTYGEGGPAIIDLGVKADQSTAIIGDAETSDGTALSGGGATSIYFAKLGGGKYLTGLQLYEIHVEKIGLLESGTAYRTVVDWPVGLQMVNPRSIARLSGIVAA